MWAYMCSWRYRAILNILYFFYFICRNHCLHYKQLDGNNIHTCNKFQFKLWQVLWNVDCQWFLTNQLSVSKKQMYTLMLKGKQSLIYILLRVYNLYTYINYKLLVLLIISQFDTVGPRLSKHLRVTSIENVFR